MIVDKPHHGLFVIYALVDPRTGEIRYVGKSTSGYRRYESHASPAVLRADATHKGRWIKTLVAQGLVYTVRILEEFPSPESLFEAEIRWIAKGRAEGWPLTNLTDGGEGALGYKHTDEAKAQLRALKLGVPAPHLRGDGNGARKKRENMGRGEKHWAARLTIEQAEEIRRRAAAGEVQLRLAEEFGVSPANINRVARGLSYTPPAVKDAVQPAPQASQQGVAHHSAKLNDAQVVEIRRRLANGETQLGLAREYNVSGVAIHNIDNGVTWVHLLSENEQKVIAARKNVAPEAHTNRKARLTPEIVRSIRKRAAQGELAVDLARELKLSDEQVCRIIRRSVWKDVPDEAPVETPDAETLATPEANG